MGQQSAQNRPQADEDEITPKENLQDDDQIIDYVPVPRLQDVDNLETPEEPAGEEEVLAVAMPGSDDDLFADDD